jgi:hypothetical protein
MLLQEELLRRRRRSREAVVELYGPGHWLMPRGFVEDEGVQVGRGQNGLRGISGSLELKGRGNTGMIDDGLSRGARKEDGWCSWSRNQIQIQNRTFRNQ